MEKDADLIEASFAAQYGIRLRQESDMSWAEFSALISGILPDTPLGIVVGVRAEKDFKRIKDFSRAEKRIYNDWRRFVASKKENAAAEQSDWGAEIERLQNALAESFG